MKKLICLIATIFFINCSNNNEDVEPSNNEENQDSVFVPGYNLFINGVKKDSLIPNLIKTGNLFFVKNHWTNTEDSFTFYDDGKFGNFSKKIANPYNSTNAVKTFQSFLFNSSNYFDLNIQNIDPTNKTIKGTFTGYIYDVKSALVNNGSGSGGGNNYITVPIISLNNEKKHVWCSFNLKYEVVPSVTTFYHTAKINNLVWESSYNRRYINPISNSYGWFFYDFYDSDSSFNIQIHNYANEVGGFVFNNSSFNNKIVVKKYNPLTDIVENYIGNGQLNVESISFPVAKGTYTFQGYNENNPSDVITITEGSFCFLQLL
jgi:hypothetical protein